MCQAGRKAALEMTAPRGWRDIINPTITAVDLKLALLINRSVIVTKKPRQMIAGAIIRIGARNTQSASQQVSEITHRLTHLL